MIRLIRVIRGLNILSFQLQNHSTSLMPTRRVGLQQPVYRLIPSVKIRVLRFIRVLFLPNNSKTQFARTTTHYLFASWPLCVSQLLSSEFYQPPQLVVIRVIRVIRGLNIL